MSELITQIGNYSFYPSRLIGKGATGSVYYGNFTVMKGLGTQTNNPLR